MKKFGAFLLAKDSNAIIVAFLAALLPMFYIPTGIVAVLVVGLVTFQKGPKSGFWLLTWVALPAIALMVLREFGLVDVLLLRCAIIWIFASLMYRTQSWALILSCLAVVGVAAVAVVHWRFPGVQAWWVTHLSSYFEKIMADSRWKTNVSPKEFINYVAPIATGLTAFFFAAGIFIELVVARFWQSVTMDSHIFGDAFVRIRMNVVAVLAISILIAFCFFKKWIALDMLPIALFPFCIAGLSLLHSWVRKNRQLIYLLIATYVGLLLVPVMIVSLLSLLAVSDVWFDFRNLKIG